MSNMKFSDIKEELNNNLQKKLGINPILGENGFSLIEGFMVLTLQKELSNDLKLAGENIPVVGVQGNTTGRIYTFALTSIIPNINI